MAHGTGLVAECISESKDSSPTSSIGKLPNLGTPSVSQATALGSGLATNTYLVVFTGQEALWYSVGCQSLASFFMLLESFLDKPPIGG